MNNQRTTCDPERIELFLQQKLNDAEQTAFESHLDDCDDCRQRLESTAASHTLSEEAQRLSALIAEFEVARSTKDDGARGGRAASAPLRRAS